MLLRLHPSECEKLVRELGPEGLLLGTSLASQREADDLVAASPVWGRCRSSHR